MAISDTTRTRSPRGTKQVITAFFVALGDVPEAQRGLVGKAALVAIRDGMKAQRDKAKVAAARAKMKAAATRVRPVAKSGDAPVARRKARVDNAAA